jgi:hypothetical protein
MLCLYTGINGSVDNNVLRNLLKMGTGTEYPHKTQATFQ